MKAKTYARRILAVVMALFMMLTYSFAGSTDSHAAQNTEGDDSSLSNSDLYEKWAESDKAPSDFDDSSADPYGYGLDVPFYMNKESELILFDTNNLRYKESSNDNRRGDEPRSFHSYDLKKGKITDDVLLGKETSKTYDIPFDNDQKKQVNSLNYVKVEAFDPTGSGRKDHIAVIGVHNEDYGQNNGDKTLYMYVYNKQGVCSSYKELGSMDWMGEQYSDDAHNCWRLNAMNFVGITSGDYDGDKKDTLVIWGCFDNTGYGLREVTVNSSASSISLTAGDVSNTLLHEEYKASGKKLAEGLYVDNKLCCALDTGDVNDDNVDDLVVLSYLGITTGVLDGQSQRSIMYSPYLSVSLGKKYLSSVVDQKSAGMNTWKEVSGEEHTSSLGSGLSVGDIDGDGSDEIVMAGMLNTVRGDPSTNVSSPYNFDKNKLVTSAYKVNVVKTQANISELAFEEKDSNGWTRNGYHPGMTDQHEDRIQPQYGVECAAINGMGNPELIFINGYLYKYNKTGSERFSEEFKPEYYQNGDDSSFDGTDFSNKFIGSVVSGNFDGNDYGYEQVIFVNAKKHGNHEWYMGALGVIGGVHNDNESGIAAEYYTNATNSNLKNRDRYFPSRDNYKDSNDKAANIGQNYGFCYTICAADTDEDGILARYSGKGYAYSDPDILAVIQAAPLFEELEPYGAGGSTSYNFSESISYEGGTSDSVSFGAGMTHSLEGTLGGYEVKAGYAMDWSHEFTEGFETSYTYGFTATTKDMVVIHRTPVTLYSYQIKQEDGTWSNKDKDNNIVLSFPGTPAYSAMSVERYNDFARYYNATNEEKAKKIQSDKPVTVPTLKVLDEDELDAYYLNTGRDPEKYINAKKIPGGVDIIQANAIAFEADSGETSFDYSKTHYTSDTDSMAHGFSFELTISFGLDIPMFVDSSLGAYASLEYMHGHTYTTTTATGTGASCEISNAERDDMIAGGFSPAACSSYGFNYQMATWDSPLTRPVPDKEKSDSSYIDPVSHVDKLSVPVFGYVLSDVKRPEYAKIASPSELTLYEGYDKTATGAFRIYGDPAPAVSKKSGNEKITYNAVTRKLEVEPGLAKGTYKVELKAANGIPSKDFTLPYTVKVIEPDFSVSAVINAVRNKIDNLPSKEELLLSDEIYVTQARNAYDSLTDDQKKSISAAQKDKLEKAEAQIKGFKDAVAALEKKVQEDLPAVRNQISLLMNSSKPSKEEIQAVQEQLEIVTEEYSALSNEQKSEVDEQKAAAITSAVQEMSQLIDKADSISMSDNEYAAKEKEDNKAAGAVNSLIAAIDLKKIDVNADEEAFEEEYQKALAQVSGARKAYEQLTAAQKGRVQKLNDLISAEKDLGDLLKQRRGVEVQKAEDAACESVKEKIAALPDVASIKYADRNAIFAAQLMYELLSPETKAKVPEELVLKLNEAWDKVKVLKTKNTMTAKGKTVKIKYKTLKKRTQKVAAKKAFTVKNPQGKVTYKVAKYDKKAKKKITVSKTGKVTVKKGLKKGKYKLTVNVTAAGTSQYFKSTKKVTLKVTVK